MLRVMSAAWPWDLPCKMARCSSARPSESPHSAPCPAPCCSVSRGLDASVSPQNEPGEVLPTARSQAGVAAWRDWDLLLLGAAHPPRRPRGAQCLVKAKGQRGSGRRRMRRMVKARCPVPAAGWFPCGSRDAPGWQRHRCGSVEAAHPANAGPRPSPRSRDLGPLRASVSPAAGSSPPVPPSEGLRARTLPVSFLPGSRPGFHHGAPWGPLRCAPPGSLTSPVLRFAGVAVPGYAGPLRQRRCPFTRRPPLKMFSTTPKMDLELIFPDAFKHLYKSPCPAAAGFSCCGCRGLLRLDLGGAFCWGWGAIRPGLALGSLCCRRACPLPQQRPVRLRNPTRRYRRSNADTSGVGRFGGSPPPRRAAIT